MTVGPDNSQDDLITVFHGLIAPYFVITIVSVVVLLRISDSQLFVRKLMLPTRYNN